MKETEIIDAVFHLIKLGLEKYDWENSKDSMRYSHDVKYKDCELIGVQLNDTISIVCTAKVKAIMGEEKVTDVESEVWLEVFENDNLLPLDYAYVTSILESKINLIYQ